MSRARPCQHAGCSRTVTRGGERGPWPKFCVPHRRAREAAQRKPLERMVTVTCLDCTARYEVSPMGNFPARCETCTRIRKRKQAAMRQARWRERHAKGE